MTTRTQRDRARRDGAKAAAIALEGRLSAIIREEYPGLCGWALRVPHYRIVRTGPREDDWHWGAYRSAADHARAYERYCARAVQVAAGRISEAYGLGAGSEWAARHFGVAGDESRAEGQLHASLAALGIVPPA